MNYQMSCMRRGKRMAATKVFDYETLTPKASCTQTQHEPGNDRVQTKKMSRIKRQWWNVILLIAVEILTRTRWTKRKSLFIDRLIVRVEKENE